MGKKKKKKGHLLSNSSSSDEKYISLLRFSKSHNKLPKIKDVPSANPSFILQGIILLNFLYLRCLEEENLAALHQCT